MAGRNGKAKHPACSTRVELTVASLDDWERR